MRQRLISAAIGIPLAIVVLFFYQTPLLNIAIALVTLLAVYEILVATKYLKNWGLAAICFAYAIYVPFAHMFHVHYLEATCSFLFLLTLLIFLLFTHRTVRLEQIGTSFMLTLLLTYSFSCIVFLRDIYAQSGPLELGCFYIVLVFLGAWIADAGAYFIGRLLGRHPLAPDISPKKTVEGAVGGVVCVVASFLIAAPVYGAYVRAHGQTAAFSVPRLVIAALLCAVMAVLGDLSASAIKRQCNIKDFGNILPGHGGVLDRFDSIMFVAPTLLIFLQRWPIVL